MKERQPIPQHDLLSEAGATLEFGLAEWGSASKYNFETAHRHNFHELLIFEKGGGRHDIDFRTYEAKKGAVHFVASDNVHLMMRDKDSKGISFQFTTDYFPQELIAQLPFSKTTQVLQLSSAEFRHVSNISKQIREEYAAGKPYYERIIRSHMQALMLFLLRIYQDHNPEMDMSTLPEHLISFMQLIKERCTEHLTVEQYAEKLNISAKHLIDLSKKHTGKTPLQHIREYMITEAKRLLYNTALSVKEIAYKLNFDEPANFSKYFKSVSGYTPLAYRKDSGK